MVMIGPFAILALIILIAIVVAIINTTLKPSADGKPRGFPWLLLAFGVVAIAGVATLIIYRSRPDEILLEVRVPSGKAFLGEVIVDGRRETIEGVGSGSFPFTGKNIAWTVLIDDSTGTDSIETSAGGVGGSSSSTWGCRGSYQKHFFGGGGMYTTVDAEEWHATMARLRPATESVDSLLPGISAPSNPEDNAATDDSSPAAEGEGEASPMDESPSGDATEAPQTEAWLRVVVEPALT